MGFLDKLLGRNKDDSATQTAPPPASTPAEPTSAPAAPAEHDHSSHEGHSHDDDAPA